MEIKSGVNIIAFDESSFDIMPLAFKVANVKTFYDEINNGTSTIIYSEYGGEWFDAVDLNIIKVTEDFKFSDIRVGDYVLLKDKSTRRVIWYRVSKIEHTETEDKTEYLLNGQMLGGFSEENLTIYNEGRSRIMQRYNVLDIVKTEAEYNKLQHLIELVRQQLIKQHD